jgi:hypothetical protein
MIRAIDYNDSRRRALGSLGGCQAAKTSAADHNTWEILGAFGSPGAAPWSAATAVATIIIFSSLCWLTFRRLPPSQPNYDGMTISRNFR